MFRPFLASKKRERQREKGKARFFQQQQQKRSKLSRRLLLFVRDAALGFCQALSHVTTRPLVMVLESAGLRPKTDSSERGVARGERRDSRSRLRLFFGAHVPSLSRRGRRRRHTQDAHLFWNTQNSRLVFSAKTAAGRARARVWGLFSTDFLFPCWHRRADMVISCVSTIVMHRRVLARRPTDGTCGTGYLKRASRIGALSLSAESSAVRARYWKR